MKDYLDEINYCGKTHPKDTIPQGGHLDCIKKRKPAGQQHPSLSASWLCWQSGQLPPAPVTHRHPATVDCPPGSLSFHQAFCHSEETFLFHQYYSLQMSVGRQTPFPSLRHRWRALIWGKGALYHIPERCHRLQQWVDLRTYLEATRISEGRISAPDAVVCDPSTQIVELGRLPWVQGQPCPHSE